MKERMEKSNIEKEERPITEELEDLKSIKAKEEKIRKEDPAYSTPWHVIDPEKLDKTALEIYGHFRIMELTELKIAQEKLIAFKEKIKEIKNSKQRENNENFIRWIDDKIGTALSNSEVRADIEKDNTR